MQIEFTGTRFMDTRVDRSMTRLGQDARSHPVRENRNPFCMCARKGEKTPILASGNAHHAPDLWLKEGHISRNPCIAKASIARTTCVCGEQR